MSSNEEASDLSQSVKNHEVALEALKDVPKILNELSKKFKINQGAEQPPGKSSWSLGLSDEENEEDADLNNIIDTKSDQGSDLNNITDTDNDNNMELETLLQDMEKTIDFGPAVMQNVSIGFVKTAVRPLTKETKSNLKERIKIPENCKEFIVPKVNGEIWRLLPAQAKVSDIKQQQNQLVLSQGLSTLTTISNVIASNKQKIPNEVVSSIVKHAMDCANIFGDQFQALSTRRRFEMKSPEETGSDANRDNNGDPSSLTKTIKDSGNFKRAAELIGVLVAACFATRYGMIYTRQLEMEKTSALRIREGRYKGSIVLSSEAKQDIGWWINNISKEFNEMKEFCQDVVIFSDASLIGWGAESNGIEARGNWTNEEKCRHINVLELVAAFYGLRSFVDKSNITVLLRVDSSNAMAYINNHGGCRSPELHAVAKQIWKWCECRNIRIRASYINTKQNVIADRLSRTKLDYSDFMLTKNYFENICKAFGQPNIDLFATYQTKQCEVYYSWKPDPFSAGTISSDHKQPQTNGRNFVRESLSRLNLSESTTAILKASKSDGTWQQYEVAFRKWNAFCQEKLWSMWEPNIEHNPDLKANGQRFEPSFFFRTGGRIFGDCSRVTATPTWSGSLPFNPSYPHSFTLTLVLPVSSHQKFSLRS
ncbi:hypothetical protein Fcan01_25143 [Folsomia candida]|uniref:RNase H type-1 domain-containing protein n=1 Tax=Folsomia candida TaxID=158441 RepID=A0A226D5N6_FOLCA|nr:hypothetical protein Fcan01_25143 [Folsomia candida]